MKGAFCLFHCSGNRCHAATSARSEEAYHASFDPEEIAGSADEERSQKDACMFLMSTAGRSPTKEGVCPSRTDRINKII